MKYANKYYFLCFSSLNLYNLIVSLSEKCVFKNTNAGYTVIIHKIYVVIYYKNHRLASVLNLEKCPVTL